MRKDTTKILKIMPMDLSMVAIELIDARTDQILGRLEVQAAVTKDGPAIGITNGGMQPDFSLDKFKVQIGNHEFISRNADDSGLQVKTTMLELVFIPAK
ncbi:Uncharacterised protein [uncultured archaeon]|nr:Uncharacterised protein [uncultured archaeon]